jgi:hypothetical protein
MAGVMTFDLRTLDLPGFRRWLDAQMARWQDDPVFVQRTRIRELRRAHPRLRQLESERRQAEAADAATPAAGRLAEVDRRLRATMKAIAGLTGALASSPAERKPSLTAKRAAFQVREQALSHERDQLVQQSPTRQQLLRLNQLLDDCRASIGLDREQAHLAELIQARGRRAGQAGAAFEREAIAITQNRILPQFNPRDGGLQVLRGVRLGAAGVELDFAIVYRPGADEPVEVRGVVEVKRNINDLAHGFLRRQIDLTWLTRDVCRYDPAAFRTGHFRTGHFDRPAVHWQDGQPFVFAPQSFRRFTRDPDSDYYLDALYLVTRAGLIWGASSAALNRIAARIATDEDWDPGNEPFLSRLFDWCRSLTGPVETPDVMSLLTATPERLRHVWMVARTTGYAD